MPSLPSSALPATSFEPAADSNLPHDYAYGLSDWPGETQLPQLYGLPAFVPEYLYGGALPPEATSPIYTPDTNYSPVQDMPQVPVESQYLPYSDRKPPGFAVDLDYPTVPTSLTPLDPLPLSNDYYQGPLGLGLEFSGASPSPVGNLARLAGREDESKLTMTAVGPVALGLPPDLDPQRRPFLRPPSRVPSLPSNDHGFRPPHLVGVSSAATDVSRSGSNSSRDLSATPALTTDASSRDSTPSTFEPSSWNQRLFQWLPSFLQPLTPSPRPVSRPTSTPATSRQTAAFPAVDERRASSSSPLRGDLARALKRRRTNHPLAQMETAEFAPPRGAPRSAPVGETLEPGLDVGGGGPTSAAAGSVREMQEAARQVQEAQRRLQGQQQQEGLPLLASSPVGVGARGRKRPRP